MYVMLSNKNDPDYGEVTIPLPIPEAEYAKCMELLSAIEIGSATEQDCKVEELHTGYKTLEQLVGTLVNVDELDYLAKQLDSFCEGEDVKFEAMAHTLDLHDVRDFINLTISCREVTVISDFKDLESVGREHFMTVNGGSASTPEFEHLNGEKVARDLIASGAGKLTPYGIVFDNGMELKQHYSGGPFPGYLYQPKVLDVVCSPSTGNPGTSYFQLPMPKEQLERLLERGGFSEGNAFPVQLGPELPPPGVAQVLEALDLKCFETEMIRDLNRMSKAIEALSKADRVKLDAVARFVEPEFPFQIQYLAEHLDCFEFVPGVKNAEEYGRYMIQESDQFHYDPDLAPYYDYQKYGDDHVAWHGGKFNECGFVAYFGELSLDKLMEPPKEQEQGPQMGGMM